ncbi:MAG: YifB family Mg chelatase-like AAA ATPase, partial [Acidimicrobiales bacterium]
MFDRIDMHIEVPAVSASDLRLPPPSEGSAEVSARVLRTRNIQKERYRGLAPNGQPIRTNAQADGELLQRVAQPDAAGEALLVQATERMKLSARSYHRMLRVARTLA